MISKDDIEHLKDLARVEFDEHETEALSKDLGAILDYMATLKEVNVDNAKEMTHAFDMQNVVRVDEHIDSVSEESQETARAIVMAFPEKDDSYLKVKAIF